MKEKLYRQHEYAVRKGVSRARITQLKKKGLLDTTQQFGVTLVKDNAKNDELFRNPSHNRKTKK